MTLKSTIKSIFAITAMSLSTITVNAQDALFSYNTGTEEINEWGTKRTDHYDVAIYVPADYAGKSVTRIRMPFTVASDGISDVKLWLSNELKLAKNANNKEVADADIISADVTIGSDRYAEVTFSQPYTISDKGIYAGCSFNVTDINTNSKCKTPITVTTTPLYGGFWIHTTKKYLSWDEKSESIGSSTMEVYIGGVKSQSVTPVSLGEVYTAYDQNFSTQFKVVNTGVNTIKDIDVSYAIGSQKDSYHIAFPTPIPNVLGASTEVSIDIPAIGQRGTQDLKITVDKVNGEANNSTNPSTSINVLSLSFVPKYRPIFEEYTGLWCGYCPRGFIGLERMNKLYPDDFIGLSYHQGDALAVMEQEDFPSKVKSYPTAWLDRAFTTDAFFGEESSGFGLDKVWLKRCKLTTKIAIEAEAVLSDDTDYIEGTITLTAATDINQPNCHIEIILTADDLYNEKWAQTNNFAGSSGLDNEDDWLVFTEGTSQLKGLHFNDVVILTTRLSNSDIAVNDPMLDNQPVKFNCTLKLDDAVTTSNKPIIQDKSKINLIAALVDNDGKMLNAFKTRVSGTSSIVDVENNDQVEITDYYDLSGRRIDNPQRGLYIARTSDGRAHKVVIK